MIFNLNKHKIFVLLILVINPLASYAANLYGNPTDIGKIGQLEMQFGGGKISAFDLDVDKGTGTTKIGSVSSSFTVPSKSLKFSEDQGFLGVSYGLNSRTSIIGNLGNL